jgi:hypothetical protein
MPAIQPARLKAQALQLTEQFTQPYDFVRELTDLLNSYADHTFRHGKEGEPLPLLAAFNTPPQVIRQVWLAISPFISLNPQAALELSDALWLQRYLEHRILATDILGQLPIDYETDVLKRVQTWIRNESEDQLIEALLGRSFKGLRANSFQVISDLAEQWLADPELQNKRLGLRLLHSLASDLSFDNLPVIFRLLSPYLRITPPALRPDVIAVLQILINRTPSETAYLLQQHLTAPDNLNSAWLLRQVITEFPPEFQTGLRSVIKRTSPSKQTRPIG